MPQLSITQLIITQLTNGKKFFFIFSLCLFLSSAALAFSVPPPDKNIQQSRLARFDESVIVREQGLLYKPITVYIEAFDKFHNLIGPGALKAGEESFLRVRIKSSQPSPVYLKIQRPFSSWYNRLYFSQVESNFEYSDSPIEFKNRKSFTEDWESVAYSFERTLNPQEEIQFYIMLTPDKGVDPSLDFIFLFALNSANKGRYESYSELRLRALYFVE